jgi:phospholipid-binding lipoprotein MlaA
MREIARIFGMRSLVGVLLALALLASASGPALAERDEPPKQLTQDVVDELDDIDEVSDPLELLNRFVFAFNQTLDIFIIRPVAATYRFVVPEPVRDSVRNVLRNLREPVTLANDLFQGDMERAEATAKRFAINSTAGVLGLFDVADGMGYPYQKEDFGQTLGVHGTGGGPYIVLPLLGPSNVRDSIGLAVDAFLDPLTYIGVNNDAEDLLIARSVLEGVDTRSRNIETLEEIERDAVDFYARIRSLYHQRRESDIRNGEPGEYAVPGLSDLDLYDEQTWKID